MVAPQLISAPAVHIESNPVAYRALECRAVCRANAFILTLDRCGVHWLAEYLVVAIPI